MQGSSVWVMQRCIVCELSFSQTVVVPYHINVFVSRQCNAGLQEEMQSMLQCSLFINTLRCIWVHVEGSWLAQFQVP